MATHERLTGTDTEELPRELVELGRQIANLPAAYQDDMGRVYEQVVDSARRRRRILALVQEALAQLRLDITSLLFDLQVACDERDALRQDFEE